MKLLDEMEDTVSEMDKVAAPWWEIILREKNRIYLEEKEERKNGDS